MDTRHTANSITDPALTDLYDERDMLLRRVDTLTAVARSNRRHVQTIVPELDRAAAERDRYRAAWLSARRRAEQATALEPAAIQTCRTCGAGYDLGQPCSICQFQQRMAAETAWLTPSNQQCGHDDYHDPHEWADHPSVSCPGHSHETDATSST